MKIAAVILNWKRADDTIACVRSLQATAPDVNVIVVDNASGDGSAEKIKAELSNITLIENPTNAGYAGGNNAGIKKALQTDADAILVLNNDLVVTPGCVDELAKTLDQLPRAGIAAPLSLLANEPTTVDFWRATIDLRNMAVHAEGRDKPKGNWKTPETTDYATGSAMLITRKLLETAAAFDERYFLVWEDVDLCLRARARGFGSVAVPTAIVLHARSSSFGGEGAPLYQYFYVRNSFLIAAMHLRWPWKKRTIAMLERRYEGWVAKSEPATADAIARGLQDARAFRFGPAPADFSAPAGS